MAEERPTGLKATSGIELLTMETPNGVKISVLLEELRAAYGVAYSWQRIDISQNIQKEPWFTALNPNGRIPVIVDHDRGGLAVFEGVAILNYLVRRFDRDHLFSFDPVAEPDQLAVAESWLAWQHGGLGPMQGQANHFLRAARASQHDMYGAQRYVGETERLYGVLEHRLATGGAAGPDSSRDYVAGAGRGRYSIVDMAILGWAQVLGFAGIDMARFPHVARWIDRCRARPATARGLAIPQATTLADYNKEARLAAGGPAAVQAEEEVAAFLAEAQAKHNYKYTSP